MPLRAARHSAPFATRGRPAVAAAALALLALLLVAVRSPNVGATVGDDPAGPAAVYAADGSYHVFAAGADQHLYQTIYTGGVWSSPQDLGSSVHGVPGLVYRSDVSRYDVFAVGGNGDLYQQIYTGGAWHGWNDIVPASLAGGVSAVYAADGTYHVFATGTDHHLYQTIYTGGVWSALQELGSAVYGAPSVVYRADVSRYDVFAVGGNGDLYQQIYTGGVWHGWNDIVAADLAGGTASVYAADGTYHVFAAGADQHMYQTIYTGGVWSALQDLSPYVHGGPGLTYRSSGNRYDLFAIGGNGHLYQQIYSSGWHGWNDIVSSVNFGTGTSSGTSCAAANSCSPQSFAQSLLGYPGVAAPDTSANEYAVQKWELAEGGGAGCPGQLPNTAPWDYSAGPAGNPLNTTRAEPGSTSWNSVHVQVYHDGSGMTCWQWGLKANGDALTLTGYYTNVISVLAHPSSVAYTQCTNLASAVAASPWGTGNFSSLC
jgi:hypothetical protein